MSGHSKFANIKHKKEKNDAAKGKIFTIIGREIAVAVKEGGPDPANNFKLATVIAKAKANNMPTATIAEQHTINGRRTIGCFAMDNEATVATTPIGMMNMPEPPAFIWQASSSHWGKAYMTT